MPRSQFAPSSIFSLAVTLFVVGCSSPQNTDNPVSFVTGYSPISFTFPAGWQKNPDKHPFDLQTQSQFEEYNTGVFVFKAEDLAVDSSPSVILQTQIEDLRSKRDNFEELEPLRETIVDGAKISEVSYVGEKDSQKNCHRFVLIEFLEDTSKFAIAIQNVRPEAWEKAKPIFEAIARSAKPLPNSK